MRTAKATKGCLHQPVWRASQRCTRCQTSRGSCRGGRPPACAKWRIAACCGALQRAPSLPAPLPASSSAPGRWREPRRGLWDPGQRKRRPPSRLRRMKSVAVNGCPCCRSKLAGASLTTGSVARELKGRLEAGYGFALDRSLPGQVWSERLNSALPQKALVHRYRFKAVLIEQWTRPCRARNSRGCSRAGRSEEWCLGPKLGGE